MGGFCGGNGGGIGGALEGREQLKEARWGPLEAREGNEALSYN